MRYLLLFIVFCISTECFAQTHQPLPAAKKKLDEAAALYIRSNGHPDSIKKIMPLVDAAIKADNKYYDAWMNKVILQCQPGDYTSALATLKKMEAIFPTIDEVWFITGILQYKSGQPAVAKTTFNKLMLRYDKTIAKDKNGTAGKQAQINKGISLILLDRDREGKAILNKLYREEKDPVTKSYMAFYINSSKEEIINDRVPGQ